MSERSFHRGKMVALGAHKASTACLLLRCDVAQGGGGVGRVKSGVKSEGWQGIRAAERRVTRALPIEFPAAVSGCWSPLTWNRPLYPLANIPLNRRREKQYRIMANSSINLNS